MISTNKEKRLELEIIEGIKELSITIRPPFSIKYINHFDPNTMMYGLGFKKRGINKLNKDVGRKCLVRSCLSSIYYLMEAGMDTLIIRDIKYTITGSMEQATIRMYPLKKGLVLKIPELNHEILE